MNTGAPQPPPDTRIPLTPEEHTRADTFALWIRCDQDAHDSEQLVLDLDCGTAPTPIRAAGTRQHPHPGDPDGLESIGSILHRYLAELYARNQVAA